MKLRDKVAIITGAGAGIGEATAVLFAEQGAKVCCNSQSDSAKKVVDKIIADGGDALFVQGDVSLEDDAKNIVGETVKKYGKIDILYNNAGIVVGGSIEACSTEDFDRCMAVNVRGIYLCSKYAIPYLKKTKGTIINCSSVVALKGVVNRAAYTASKGAVLSMTKAMAMDHIKDKIRVNAICPGTIDTPSLAVRLSQMDNPEQARRQFVARQPMGRLGTPEEIAQGVLLLVLNEFCTGTILPIDGGMTI
ncbi:MAG: SDR family oxidoreductase [Deltaproteobacteria bacterium]|nr:SDR family oxidoreductase [Deltaproteobacteria bacterium]